MAELRTSSIGIEDIQKYIDPLMYSLSMERQELRELRLPLPRDIDKHGLLYSFKNRKEEMLEREEKKVIQQLISLALAHGLQTDVKIKEMIGENGEKINKDNFMIIKGFVLQFIDKKMIEQAERMKETGSIYAGRSR